MYDPKVDFLLHTTMVNDNYSIDSHLVKLNIEKMGMRKKIFLKIFNNSCL